MVQCWIFVPLHWWYRSKLDNVDSAGHLWSAQLLSRSSEEASPFHSHCLTPTNFSALNVHGTAIRRSQCLFTTKFGKPSTGLMIATCIYSPKFSSSPFLNSQPAHTYHTLSPGLLWRKMQANNQLSPIISACSRTEQSTSPRKAAYKLQNLPKLIKSTLVYSELRACV